MKHCDQNVNYKLQTRFIFPVQPPYILCTIKSECLPGRSLSINIQDNESAIFFVWERLMIISFQKIGWNILSGCLPPPTFHGCKCANPLDGGVRPWEHILTVWKVPIEYLLWIYLKWPLIPGSICLQLIFFQVHDFNVIIFLNFQNFLDSKSGRFLLYDFERGMGLPRAPVMQCIPLI